MSDSISLQASLAESSIQTDARRFVNLTQLAETGMDKTASMYDIAQMIAIARSGHSAHLYKKNACPAGVTATGVNIRLPFEAWPSSLDFKYTLSSNIGEISPPTIIEEYTEFSIKFDKTNVVRLDFMLKSIESYEWETPCFTPKGQPLPNQELRLENMSLLLTDDVVFGVVRIKGKKVGALYVLTHTLIKEYPERPGEPLPDEDITAEDLENYWGFTDVDGWNGQPVGPNDTVNLTGYSIDNLEIIVTATWKSLKDEDKHNSKRLEIPQCVKDLLKRCDGDLDRFDGSNTIICPDDDQEVKLIVYYSKCSGEILEEREIEKDPDSWCE